MCVPVPRNHKALVPADAHHGNKKNSQHQEAIIKRVKNKIIKKTKEKGTKIKGIILPRKTRAVSYTHLDVYKRQMQGKYLLLFINSFLMHIFRMMLTSLPH